MVFLAERPLVRIRFELLALITMALPILSLLLCVVVSLYFEFERSVATHCGVPNYLPSLSASIGGFTPQRYIWRIGVAFHCAPRILVALMYLSFYHCFPSLTSNVIFTRLIRANFLLNLLELMALVILTYVSSTENYKVHEAMFVCFMICSIAYMLATILLFRRLRLTSPSDSDITRSLNAKTRIFLANVSIFLISLYFFFRHNKYCEPGVYTFFALCEYLVVLTNIAFHGTAYLDFRNFVIIAKNDQDGQLFVRGKTEA